MDSGFFLFCHCRETLKYVINCKTIYLFRVYFVPLNSYVC